MMKKIVFLSCSILVLFTVVTTRINTQELEDAPNIQLVQEDRENFLSPPALVRAAYKGMFKDWNIPSYAQLQSSYDLGKITANDVINAAIEAGKLSPQAAEDNRYIKDVDTELEQLHEE